MNTEKLSPFEGLRLVANAAKGFILHSRLRRLPELLKGLWTI